MKCPKCDIEARITSSKNVMKDGKLFRRMEFSCRNKQCANYEKVIATDDVPLEYEIVEE